jgi:hypothetical protein
MTDKKKYPDTLPGTTSSKPTGCGSLYTIINTHEGRPVHLFAVLGKAGGCAACHLQAEARLISLALQGKFREIEGTQELIIKTLSGINCPKFKRTSDKNMPLWTCPFRKNVFNNKGMKPVKACIKREGNK